jgi:hypothetical protein
MKSRKEILEAVLAELGDDDHPSVAAMRNELAKINAQIVGPVHTHTLSWAVTRGGGVKVLKDQLRVEVKPAVSQAQIEAIKTAFDEGHSVAATAQLLQSVRDATGTSSWTALADIVHGGDRGRLRGFVGVTPRDPDQRLWGVAIFTCLGLAHLAGEPVYVTNITRAWVQRRLAPLSAEQRTQLWTDTCNRNVTVDWTQYGYGVEPTDEE